MWVFLCGQLQLSLATVSSLGIGSRSVLGVRAPQSARCCWATQRSDRVTGGGPVLPGRKPRLVSPAARARLGPHPAFGFCHQGPSGGNKHPLLFVLLFFTLDFFVFLDSERRALMPGWGALQRLLEGSGGSVRSLEAKH